MLYPIIVTLEYQRITKIHILKDNLIQLLMGLSGLITLLICLVTNAMDIAILVANSLLQAIPYPAETLFQLWNDKVIPMEVSHD